MSDHWKPRPRPPTTEKYWKPKPKLRLVHEKPRRRLSWKRMGHHARVALIGLALGALIVAFAGSFLWTDKATWLGMGGPRNCAQARAMGIAPMYKGDPNYRVYLDADLDGIACEPVPVRR